MSTSSKRSIGLLVLLVIGVLICMKGVTPAENSGEKFLPYLSALFLLLMHLPLQWESEPKSIPQSRWILPAVLLIAGNMLDIILLQASGWVAAWSLWTDATVKSAALNPKRSAIAFLFVFPWITHDFPEVGWWYRLSGAWITEHLFLGLGVPVTRQGTEMLIGGVPMSVEAGCAGMGLLQSMLVVGTFLLLITYPRSKMFFLLLPALPVVAWMANTLRIVTISAVGLWMGAEFSQGIFHTFGGLLVIVTMVLLCLALLWLIRRQFPERPRT